MKLQTLVVPILLTAAALASAQSALAQGQTLADAEARAVLKSDTAWYQKNLAPEYKETGQDGKVEDKAQTISKLSQDRKQLKATRVVAKVTQATIKGDRMSTTTEVEVVGTGDLGDGKKHAIDFRETALATWTRRGGAWLKLTERATKARGTIDGKAIPG